MSDLKDEIDWEDRDQFENQDPVESQDDLSVTADAFEQLSIAPSDWTVSTIYDLIGKQLQLDPAYQRRNVWASKSKSQFIESLILGIPIPQILLASKVGQKNSFLVLDGKQRLTAIKEFFDGRFSDGRPFKLKDLRILKNLEGMSWSDLETDDEWRDELRNEPLRTTVLRGWGNEGVLYEIFYRLNSGSVRLSPMELRMSLYPGEFLKFIIAWTETVGPLHHLLRKRRPDARMSDVELAIRFLAFQDKDLEYRGDLKDFLDKCCQKKNAEFAEDPAARVAVEDSLASMNTAILSGIEIFGEGQFCRKFNEDEYESRFNRAVFDVLVGSLAIANVRDWADSNRGQFVSLYETVATQHPEFIKAVETTTKSTESTRTRFSIWYNAVHQETGENLDLPTIR